MNNALVQHFLSMHWDNAWNGVLNSKTDDVISLLNSTLSEWSFEVTDIKLIKDDSIIFLALYMPGKVASGAGRTEKEAISNIISLLFHNNNTDNSQVSKTETIQNPQQINNVQPQTNTETVSVNSVMEKINSIKKNITNNSSEQPNNNTTSDDMFNMLLGTPTGQKDPEPTPTEAEFGSKEAEEFDRQFFEQIKKVEKLTPDVVNPTRRLIPRSEWVPSQGEALKQWMSKFDVSKKEEVDAWLNKFCGLTYDYFDPKFVDKFIEWAEYMREKQTY